MKNKVELLRSLCFDKETLETIKNLPKIFSDKDIEFIIEFKKIYELGIDQLDKFLAKLENEGSQLDTYSIQYYVNQLKSGPFADLVISKTASSKYFKESPDSMGVMGNLTRSPSNVSLYAKDAIPMGCAVTTYNKLPDFVQKNLQTAHKVVEDVFRSSLKSSTMYDNTMPIINKNNGSRMGKEKTGSWVYTSNGTYLVKDSAFYNNLTNITKKVFSQINEYLGDEDYRMYTDKKNYNPFGNTNESITEPLVLEKQVGSHIEEIDIMGDVYDSDEKRKAVIIVDTGNNVEKFTINTNKGQLGN
jgi:hypothetical protein